MKKRKTLENLTIKDNFLFGVIMSDERNSKPFLEMLLGISIDRIKVFKEKSIGYRPDKRSVRLDVYASDENNTCYNIEMQAFKKDSLVKRARYYHSQIDMELISTGTQYKELPTVFVIFVCDFDPFDKSKYRYTVYNKCDEESSLVIKDGVKSIYLNTFGTNDSEVSESLKKFLEFVHAPLEESEKDFGDPYVKQLQDSIAQVKQDREVGAEYMLFQELLNDEREEGRAEGREEGREDKLKEIVANMLEKKLSVEEIAAFAGEDVQVINKISNSLTK